MLQICSDQGLPCKNLYSAWTGALLQCCCVGLLIVFTASRELPWPAQAATLIPCVIERITSNTLFFTLLKINTALLFQKDL